MPIVPAVPLEAARRSRRRRKLHHSAVWKPVGWPTSFGPPQLWNRQFIVHSSVHTLYLPCPAYIGEIHKVTIIYLQLSPNHPFLWDFPWNQASSCYWGYHHLWNPPYITVPNISNINCTCFIFFSVKSPSYSRKIYETSQSWPDFSASKRGKKGSFTVSQIHMVVQRIAGWWYTYPSEKWCTSSVGMILPNIWTIIKFHGSKPPTR